MGGGAGVTGPEGLTSPPVPGGHRAWAVALAGALAACQAHPLLRDLDASPPLAVDPGDYDFSEHPELFDRLIGSYYKYFRFINRDFADAVCRRFAGRLEAMPTVNLHGDAHLEQYAVTTVGRGLADFDDSSIGPAVIDLVRFGVSLELAVRTRDWPDPDHTLLDRFFAGYVASLENPEVSATAPSVADRIRAGFVSDRSRFFERAEAVSEPIDDRLRARIEAGYATYAEDMAAENPELAPDYFKPAWFRRLRLGYGSALDPKFLVRIRGPSDAPSDDGILEIKQVRDLSTVSCLRRRSSRDVFRILVAQARLAEIPLKFVGELRVAQMPNNEAFWVHAWFNNYEEVSVDPGVRPPSRTIRSLAEIAEIAYDVGLQLGRGHVREIASPLDLKLRRAQLRSFKSSERDIRAAVDELADRTVRGYASFCRAAGVEPTL